MRTIALATLLGFYITSAVALENTNPSPGPTGQPAAKEAPKIAPLNPVAEVLRKKREQAEQDAKRKKEDELRKAEKESVKEKRAPMLSMNFDKRHVYFQRSLRQAIHQNERGSAGNTYEIVSKVPSGNTRNQNNRINERASQNVEEVVRELIALGVPPERITTRIEPTDEGKQSVEVFTGNMPEDE